MAEKKPFKIKSYGPARKVKDKRVPQSAKMTRKLNEQEMKMSGGSVDLEKLVKAKANYKKSGIRKR